MNKKLVSAAAYALLLVAMLGAYLVAARMYKPHVVKKLDIGRRQSGMGAFVHSHSQHGEKALELCQRSVITSPDSAEAHFNLATLYFQAGRDTEAIVEFREAIRCQPKWVAPHIDLGIVLGNLGRLEEAADEFRQAPDDPVARHNLEMAERALRQQNERLRPPLAR